MLYVSTHAAWRAGLGIVASASLLLAGCSSSSNSAATQSSPGIPAASASTSEAHVVANGTVRGIGDVPWSQVGPGWMLAMWTPVTPHMPGNQPAADEPNPETSTDVLYLVSPTGDRYSITEFPAGEDTPDVVDWSGDGSHALLMPHYGEDGDAISLDLHTGARTTIPDTGALEYTRPDGKALLSSSSYNGNEPGTLKRIDMAGNVQFLYPTEDLGGAGQFSAITSNRLTGLSSCWAPRTSATRSCRGPTTAWW